MTPDGKRIPLAVCIGKVREIMEKTKQRNELLAELVDRCLRDELAEAPRRSLSVYAYKRRLARALLDAGLGSTARARGNWKEVERG